MKVFWGLIAFLNYTSRAGNEERERVCYFIHQSILVCAGVCRCNLLLLNSYWTLVLVHHFYVLEVARNFLGAVTTLEAFDAKMMCINFPHAGPVKARGCPIKGDKVSCLDTFTVPWPPALTSDLQSVHTMGSNETSGKWKRSAPPQGQWLYEGRRRKRRSWGRPGQEEG